ncbi:MAG: hypothetical protein NXH85_17860 [Pseudomonadaceae bacterium]|nr:hypothetical protein [Pseudomonadaceae bacterium]
MQPNTRVTSLLIPIVVALLAGCSAGTLQAPNLATSVVAPGSALVSKPGQVWRYPGVPYPTEANARLSERAGYSPWPFDPFSLVAPTPSAWPSAEQENAYYVNPQHPDAIDAGNRFGYPDRPRRSPPPDGRFGPGTIIALEGSYKDSAENYREDLSWQFDCSATQPCWLHGSGTLHSTRVNLGGSAWFIVDGLTFADSSEATKKRSFRALALKSPRGADSHHGVFRNLTIKDRAAPANLGGAAIALSPGAAGGHNHNLIVYRTTIRGVGWQRGEQNFNWRTSNPDAHGISVAGTPDNHELTSTSLVWLIDNDVSYAAGNGFQCITRQSQRGETRRSAHHIWLAGNDMHHNQQAGIWAKRCSDVVISANRSFGANIAYAGGNNNGIGNQYGPDHFWVIFNEIYDNSHGSKRSSTNGRDARDSDDHAGRQYWVGNLIHHNIDADNESFQRRFKKGGCIDLWRGNAFAFVVDNTCYANSAGIRAFAGGFGDVHAQGNLIHLLNDPLDAANPGSCIAVPSAYTQQGKGRAYNNLCNVNAWEFPGPMGSFAMNISGRAAGNRKADVSVRDAGAGDYRPVAGSELVDANPATDRVDVYAEFEARYGLSIRHDFRGLPRVVGEAADVGAFELQVDER